MRPPAVSVAFSRRWREARAPSKTRSWLAAHCEPGLATLRPRKPAPYSGLQAGQAGEGGWAPQEGCMGRQGVIMFSAGPQ